MAKNWALSAMRRFHAYMDANKFQILSKHTIKNTTLLILTIKNSCAPQSRNKVTNVSTSAAYALNRMTTSNMGKRRMAMNKSNLTYSRISEATINLHAKIVRGVGALMGEASALVELCRCVAAEKLSCQLVPQV